MKELHLKYKMETGDSSPMVNMDYYKIEVATDEHLEWLEDLAEKYLKQQKVNADANKVMAKFESIKSAFNILQNEITSIDEGMPIPDYLYNALGDACSQLESEIYD
jgi:predicted metal-binding transcription factor (methanogenesis marker protein 9)